ncbi:hypothetical protein ACXYMO_06865 [Arenibacterium sp. CAU 1754]
MIVALILMGSVAGIFTGITAFILGSSLLTAFFLYSAVGVSTVVAGMLAVCVTTRLRERSSERMMRPDLSHTECAPERAEAFVRATAGSNRTSRLDPARQ